MMLVYLSRRTKSCSRITARLNMMESLNQQFYASCPIAVPTQNILLCTKKSRKAQNGYILLNATANTDQQVVRGN